MPSVPLWLNIRGQFSVSNARNSLPDKTSSTDNHRRFSCAGTGIQRLLTRVPIGPTAFRAQHSGDALLISISNLAWCHQNPDSWGPFCALGQSQDRSKTALRRRRREETVQGGSPMGRFHPGVGSRRNARSLRGSRGGSWPETLRPAMGGRLRHWFNGGGGYHAETAGFVRLGAV